MGTKEENIKRMQELIPILDDAAKAYYVDGIEKISNFEYDAMYDELEALEKETGIVLSGSPTRKVGYEVMSELPKERHASPMLSLGKTKSVEELESFVGDKQALLSWKMDGLTIVLTYNNGELIKAVTRGNGEIGEIITPNAKVFKNIPLSIEYKGELVIRGEAVIKYSDFNNINDSIPDMQARYKNPRNLCSGSVRALNSEVTAGRNVYFYAFALVSADIDNHNSRDYEFKWLKEQGFTTVDYHLVDKTNIDKYVKQMESEIKTNEFPSDGLVLLFDDIAYGNSLGSTAKFPRNAIAFKWQDEVASTHIREIEWSASRTGLINPVAIFDEVELEGTTVERSSLHNISYIKSLELGIGDEIEVYKANMIIPQIAKNITKSCKFEIPAKCPVCGENTYIDDTNGVEVLMCPNAKCPAKHIKSFVHFASRDAMNIDGFSEATAEKFIQERFIKHFHDIYHLDDYRENIVTMPGFGEKSYANLIDAVEKSRTTELYHLIYGLGIAGIGVSNAKVLCKNIEDPMDVLTVTEEELINIDGFGNVLADSFVGYFADEDNKDEYIKLLQELNIIKTEQNVSNVLEGKTFVITGSLNTYENRDALKAHIESLGGKVSGSVSGNTSYLINNDVNSTTGKNKKAKELGIPIISEEDFREMIV